MSENEASVPESRKRTGKEQAGDCPSRVLGHLGEYRGNVWYEIATAIRRSRMNVDEGFAAIEFVEHWRVGGIAGPFITVTRQKDDSIRFEHIQSVRDLPQGAFDVGEWR